MDTNHISDKWPIIGEQCVYRVRLGRVVDGDTVILHTHLGRNIWIEKEWYRLIGIDAPEMRGEERPHGEVSKQFLIDLFDEYGTRMLVRTKRDKKDVYGRILAELWLLGLPVSVNQHLIDSCMAEPASY